MRWYEWSGRGESNSRHTAWEAEFTAFLFKELAQIWHLFGTGFDLLCGMILPSATRGVSQMAKQMPTHRARLGNLQAAVWENDYKDSNGQEKTFHTITLERSYRDQDGEWKKSHQLGANDVASAIVLLRNIADFLMRE